MIGIPHILIATLGVVAGIVFGAIPGMTATSLLPDAGRAAGIEFPELCTRLIESALAVR